MKQETTRRDVLKLAGTASAVSGLAITATADESERVRVVEAGLRFEVPSNDEYDLVLPDSRPPYTVDEEERKLVVLNTASPETASRIRNAGDILDERTAAEVAVGPRDGRVKALPTELSSRMRAKRAVRLAEPSRVPTVSLDAGANVPVLNAGSKEPVELAAGERRELRLDPVAARARTSRVVGEATVDGVPEFMQGLKRERDSVDIEATPVVEAINHGELVVEEQGPSPK